MPRFTRRLRYEILETRNLLSGTAEAEDVPAVRVEIPDQLVILPAAQFTVPVNIGVAAGLRGAEVTLAYDTALLDTDDAKITAGSVWSAAGAEVVANVDDANGTITVWIFQAEDIDPQAGSLLNITFLVSGQVSSGSTTRIDLTHVRLNEDQIVADPAPIPGADETDGVITFFARPTVSIQDVSQLEGDTGQTPFVFQVSLSGASIAEVRVDYVTADGTATVADNDYLPASGTLVFQPGETSKTITVLVTGDTKVEPDEQFIVQLQNLFQVEPGKTTAIGTILNDDVAPIGAGTLAGVVFADTNFNNLPDPQEGVPGVKLSLFDSQGVLLQETFTDQHGWYEFRELPAGDYRIEQRQPASMFDGGPNELNVLLAAGEQQSDQHFRELGLRPEYVFNRLLAASVQPPGSTLWTETVANIEETAQIDAGNTIDPAPPIVTQEIVLQGTQLILRGTNGNDHFRFDAGPTVHTVTLNGESRTVDPAQVTSVRFIGGLGSDTAELNGVAANDQAELSPKFASLRGADYAVTADSTEHALVRSTGADTLARISDSPWDDSLLAEDNLAQLTAPRADPARPTPPIYTQQVQGFRRVVASSQRGGQDRVSVLQPLDYVFEQIGSWLPE